jgi:hypothetical protein
MKSSKAAKKRKYQRNGASSAKISESEMASKKSATK